MFDKTPNDRGTPEEQANNPFSLDGLRLTQDYEAALGMKRHVTTVPVRKPDKQEWIRVRPGEEHRLQTALLELKEDNKSHYLVAPALWPEVQEFIVRKLLVTGVTRTGIAFLWPIRLPDSDGQLDTWNQSALQALPIGERSWISVRSSKQHAAYLVYEPKGDLGEPKWPDMPFQELLQLAFRDRMISTLDHAVLKKLRGEI